MVNKIISTLTILFITIAPSYQLQNLCGSDPAVTHVPDPSSCHLYITCNRINGTVVPRHGSCYGSGADYVRSDDTYGLYCISSNSHCTSTSWSCPSAGADDIMVADPYDRNCRRHRPCRNLSGSFSECSGSLVFNRNTGLCDLPENAPCSRVPLPVQCPAGYTGFYPGNFCFQYVYCQNGSVMLNLECNSGMYFNEVAGSCLFDSVYDPVCPRAGNAEGNEGKLL
ncbi:uncharacterized protein [Chironomus tepperi]|uniref:uncharacterized protein isoform X2 n=1 Tax=Chironomus tepperi TaxID=113505 RepID=UPI00391FC8B1